MDKTVEKIIPGIVQQHNEEAAFLWWVREGAIGSPHYNIKELAGLDDRVEAHVDGLRIAGEPGWEICKEALGQEEAGEVFAASVLAFESGEDSHIEAVLEAGAKSYELSCELVSALGWIPYDSLSDRLDQFLKDDSFLLQRLGIAGSAIHRKDPGTVLGDLLESDDVLLQARPLKAAGGIAKAGSSWTS